jgi:hypothetical protein
MHNASMSPITQRELRARLKDFLSPALISGGRMYEELGVEWGAARIDVAVVANGLHAFELKSDLDSFARMHNQIHAYNRVFDRLWIVVGSSHVQAAMTIVPRWWGILVGQRSASLDVELQQIRPAMVNPSQEAFSLAALLWRDEAMRLMRDYGVRFAKRATRLQLSAMLADALELPTLRDAVAGCLLGREPATASIS